MSKFLSKIFCKSLKSGNQSFYPSRWKWIIIHHSLTKDQKVVDWSAIRKYHKNVLGWSDIGYHMGIEGIRESSTRDKVYEILVGRQLNETGAHCKQQGKNRDGIGICLIGNFDLKPPSEEQLEKLIKLVKALMEVFQIPAKNVKRHSDFASYKTCPGKKFPWEEFKLKLQPKKGVEK